MNDTRTIDELKDRGTGRPAPPAVLHLYGEAFDKYGTSALWSWRRIERPTITQALAIAGALRVEGDVAARAFAERIENACRAVA